MTRQCFASDNSQVVGAVERNGVVEHPQAAGTKELVDVDAIRLVGFGRQQLSADDAGQEPGLVAVLRRHEAGSERSEEEELGRRRAPGPYCLDRIRAAQALDEDGARENSQDTERKPASPRTLESERKQRERAGDEQAIGAYRDGITKAQADDCIPALGGKRAAQEEDRRPLETAARRRAQDEREQREDEEDLVPRPDQHQHTP
jgi:hypothetical protein